MRLSNRIAAFAAVGFVAAALVPVALGSNGGGNKSGSSLNLVVLSSSAQAAAAIAPQWGDQVMFNATTSAAYPAVQLVCYQSGALVFNQTVGAFPSYGGSQVFTLASSLWTAGAADCAAFLSTTSSSGKQTTLATLSFSVNG